MFNRLNFITKMKLFKWLLAVLIKIPENTKLIKLILNSICWKSLEELRQTYYKATKHMIWMAMNWCKWLLIVMDI